MSEDEYGFVEGQFIKKTIVDILTEYIVMARSFFPQANLLSSSPLYTLLKMIAYREARLWELLETFILESHLSGASGETLDRFGADLGLPRIQPSKATGTAQFLVTPPVTIPADYEIKNASNYTYYVDSELEVSDIIEFTRSAYSLDKKDNFPSWIECTSQTNIEWISDTQDGNNPYSPDTDYTFDYSENVIDWSKIGKEPPPSSTYYVKISGKINVNVNITAADSGSGYNTAADTITTIVSPIDGIESVTNPSPITSGKDLEGDSRYRSRLLSFPRQIWSLERIQSFVSMMPDVRSAKVRWESFVDQNNSFSLAQGKTLNVDSPICQIFKPDISSISKVTINMRVIGDVDPFTVELRNVPVKYDGSLDYYAAATQDINLISSDFKSKNEIDPDGTTAFREVDFNVSSNHLDNTRYYMLRLKPSSSIGAGCSYEVVYSDNEVYIDGGLYNEQTDTYESQKDIWFKTWTHYAGITTIIATTEDFDEVETMVQTLLDDVAPIGVSVSIQEAKPVYVYVSGKLILDSGYTLPSVSSAISETLSEYIYTLGIGDTLRWSEVHYLIMSTPGVVDAKNVKIYHKRSTDSEFTENSTYEDIGINDDEICEFTGVDFDIYGGD